MSLGAFDPLLVEAAWMDVDAAGDGLWDEVLADATGGGGVEDVIDVGTLELDLVFGSVGVTVNRRIDVGTDELDLTLGDVGVSVGREIAVGAMLLNLVFRPVSIELSTDVPMVVDESSPSMLEPMVEGLIRPLVRSLFR